MRNANHLVDDCFTNAKRWRAEMEALRTIMLESPLVEELKWRQPCYTFEGSAIVIIGEYKDCCVLSFFKGALLTDSAGILSKPGENSQSARVIQFTTIEDIAEKEPMIKAYIQEAIEAEQAGLKVAFKAKTEIEYPEELLAKFEENSALQLAFEALTPGRQRAYILHFSGAKQAATRTSRIEKLIPQILDGKGIND